MLLVVLFCFSTAHAVYDPTKVILKVMERKFQKDKIEKQKQIEKEEQENCVNFEAKKAAVKTQIDGTCYSYAASLIFDQLYHQENPGSSANSSGLATAIRQAKSMSDNDVVERAKKNYRAHEGGFVCNIFNEQYRNQEICSFADIENQILLKPNSSYTRYISDLMNIYTVYKSSPYINSFLKQAKNISPQLEKALVSELGIQIKNGEIYYKGRPANTFAYDQLLQDLTCSQTKNLDDVLRVAMMALEEKKPKDYLATIIDEKCHEKLKLSNPYSCYNRFADDDRSLQRNLFAYFSNPKKREIPLGVNYCLSFFTEGKNYVPGKSPCLAHASVLNGMRWNAQTKSCQVHIVNSHGPNGCNGIAKENYFECTNGTMWVNQRDFFRAKTDEKMLFSEVIKNEPTSANTPTSY